MPLRFWMTRIVFTRSKRLGGARALLAVCQHPLLFLRNWNAFILGENNDKHRWSADALFGLQVRSLQT